MKNQTYNIGLALSLFYPELSKLLEEGIRRTIPSHHHLIARTVLGSGELAFLAHHLFKKHQCDAVITSGVVIRGQTSHYNSVCRMVEQGLINVQSQWEKPVINGVLMVENIQQAFDRLSKDRHVGEHSAKACLHILKSLS